MDSNKIEVLNALCDCIIKMQAIKISRVALFVLAICTIAAALIRVNAPGSILKAHKITLFMGNPQVAATDMLLDTGSSLTILPCASCVKCFGLKESIKYDPTVSFTSSAIKCVSMLSIRTPMNEFVTIDAKKINNFANTTLNI
jgi:hypothetical protein